MLSAPARRLRDAAEPLAMHATGSAAVREELARLGLDRFAGYVWSRAAGLGEPSAGAVVASFGVFEPSLLSRVYEAARGTCGRDRLLAVRLGATTDSLRRVLGEPDVTDVVAVLRRGLSACSYEGRPLFAGLLALPWPEHPLAQLWRACELLREHRGDTHLRVCVGHGLRAVEMNLLTELWLGMPPTAYTRTRGWEDDQIALAVDDLARRGLLRDGRLTPEGESLRTAVEDETNLGQRELVEAVGPDLERVVTALDAWSQQCVTAGTFTTDPAKRAAG